MNIIFPPLKKWFFPRFAFLSRFFSGPSPDPITPPIYSWTIFRGRCFFAGTADCCRWLPLPRSTLSVPLDTVCFILYRPFFVSFSYGSRIVWCIFSLLVRIFIFPLFFCWLLCRIRCSCCWLVLVVLLLPPSPPPPDRGGWWFFKYIHPLRGKMCIIYTTYTKYT